MTNHRSRSLSQTLILILLAIYLAVVAAITILPTTLSTFRYPRENHVNLIPLDYSFRCFLQDPAAHLTAFCVKNTLGNIALFIPLGVLAPLVSARFRSLGRMLLLAVCLSLSIETIQFVLRFFGNPRAVDIDDVILNTLGAVLGYLLVRRAR
jgi:glycopeptide antibiotics resistance protein